MIKIQIFWGHFDNSVNRGRLLTFIGVSCVLVPFQYYKVFSVLIDTPDPGIIMPYYNTALLVILRSYTYEVTGCREGHFVTRVSLHTVTFFGSGKTRRDHDASMQQTTRQQLPLVGC